MQIYALRMFNFFRFREKDNSVLFDLLPCHKQAMANGTSLDDIYNDIMKDSKSQLEYIAEVKKQGITNLIAICGMMGNNHDRNNGSGKSTLLESICYALYDRVVRKNLSTDKEKAGKSVVTKFDDKYPDGLKESYVEMIFEEKEEFYYLKRGRSFTKSSDTPSLLFYQIGESKKSRSGHRTGDTSVEIIKTIGMDYDIFCSSVMFGQADTNKLLSGTDKDRKDMLIGLLNLDAVVSGCLQKIRDAKNGKKSEVDTLRAQVDMLTKDLQGKRTIDALQTKIVQEEAQIKVYDEQAKDLSLELERLSNTDVLKQLESIRSEGSKIKTDLDNKKKQKDLQIAEWIGLAKNAEGAIQKKQKEITELEGKNVDLANKINITKNKVDSFKMEERQKDLMMVQKAKEAKPKYIKLVDDLGKKKQEISKDMAVEEADKKRINKEIKSLQEQLNNTGGNSQFICDKCKSTVSKSHLENELAKNNAELETVCKTNALHNAELEKVQTELRANEERLEKINDWLIKEGNIKASIQDNDNNKVRIQELQVQQEDNKKTLVKLNLEKEEYGKQNAQYQSKISEVNLQFQAEISALETQIQELTTKYKKGDILAKEVKDKIDGVKKRQESLSLNKSTSSSTIGSLKKEIETVQNDTQRLEKLTETYGKENKVLNRLITLDEIFGLEGIKTRIVINYLPLLNIYVKEFLDILSGGEMSMSLEFNQSHEIKVLIKGNSGSTYSMLSGGEKEIARLSLAIATGLLSFTRIAQKPSIIALDEVFGPLDGVRTEAVFKLLANLKDRFARVLVIAHNAKINSQIEHKILVEKEYGIFGRSKIKELS